LEENVKIYTDYFKKNGWQLNTGIDNKDLKVVSATKDNLQAQVTINQNSATKIKTVSISVMEINPAGAK
jgi:hypothetical protein